MKPNTAFPLHFLLPRTHPECRLCFVDLMSEYEYAPSKQESVSMAWGNQTLQKNTCSWRTGADTSTPFFLEGDSLCRN